MNIPRLSVGDKVVCISDADHDGSRYGVPVEVCVGKIYTVSAVTNQTSNQLVGLDESGETEGCWFSHRFVKGTELSEVEKIIYDIVS